MGEDADVDGDLLLMNFLFLFILFVFLEDQLTFLSFHLLDLSAADLLSEFYTLLGADVIHAIMLPGYTTILYTAKDRISISVLYI